MVRLLRVMLENATGEFYGLEVASRAGVATGTAYPILARLERAGWLRSEWEDIDPVLEGRRPRRYYRLDGVAATRAHALVQDALGVEMSKPRWAVR